MTPKRSSHSSTRARTSLNWPRKSLPARQVQKAAEAAAKLNKGEYTKEPVQTQFGWHVIILDDTRESTPPPFEDVKDRLKMLLANQQLQQHIEELKSSANIEIKE